MLKHFVIILLLGINYTGFAQIKNNPDPSLSTYLCYEYDSLFLNNENLLILKAFINDNTKKYAVERIGIQALPNSADYNNIKLLKSRVKLVKSELIRMGIKAKLIDIAILDYDQRFHPGWTCNKVGLILFFAPLPPR